MLVYDRFPVGSVELTAEGYLLVPSRISRTGIQEYYGYEFGLEPYDKLFRFYRPADEVFAPASLASFAMKPVTIGHPEGGVQATTWGKYAKGAVGQPIRDGEHVRAALLITDPDAINEVQRGTVELSCGYDCTLDMTPGATDQGEMFDGVMREIKGNHVAIVPEGRCGPSCKIGDAATGSPKVVALYASAASQKALREWAVAQGFDLTRKWGGEAVDPEAFRFHITLLATRDPITLPTGSHQIPEITVTMPVGFIAIGNDGDTPALAFGTDAALDRLRQHYVQTYKARPTYPDFKPHISLSYAWAGIPDLTSIALPNFPIVLDTIVVDDLTPKGDAAVTKAADCGGNPACKCKTTKTPGDKTMTKSVTIDGRTFEVPDDVAAALAADAAKTSTMFGDVKELLTSTSAALADMKAKQEAADKAAAEAKAAADAAEKAKPTDADIAKMAADRSALIDTAKKIVPDFEAGDKSLADIRSAVVAKKMGDAAIKDKSADYIAAMFDTLAVTSNDNGEDDPVRRASKGAGDKAALTGRAAYLANMSDAWKGPAAK